MGLLAVFGITNDGLNLAVNLLLLFLVVFWFALVYWTYADARRRIGDPLLVGCATAASLFPFVGTVVYMIVRPPEYMDDVRERELEIAAAEARLASSEHHVCPYCSYEVEKAFLRCPSCLRRLKEPCTTCGKPLDPRWTICPYCEAEVGQAPPPARRERSRRRERQPVGAGGAQRATPAPERTRATPAAGPGAADGAEQRPPRPAPADGAEQRSPRPAPADGADQRPSRPAPADGADQRSPRPAARPARQADPQATKRGRPAS